MPSQNTEMYCNKWVQLIVLFTTEEYKGEYKVRNIQAIASGWLSTSWWMRLVSLLNHPPALLPRKTVQKLPTPNEPTNVTLFCKFICKLLHNTMMSSQSVDFIAKHGWYDWSQKDYGVATRRWLQYAKVKEKGQFDLGVENILWETISIHSIRNFFLWNSGTME